MKIIKNFNTFAILLPFTILICYPFVKETAFFFSMLSTMVTGAIQVLLAIYLLFRMPKNSHLIFYLIMVVLFFILWKLNDSLGYHDVLSLFLFVMPVCLLVYLSCIIYNLKT